MRTPQWLQDYRDREYARAYHLATQAPHKRCEPCVVMASVFELLADEVGKKSWGGPLSEHEASELNQALKAMAQDIRDQEDLGPLMRWVCHTTFWQHLLLKRDDYLKAIRQGYEYRAKYILDLGSPQDTIQTIINDINKMREERELEENWATAWPTEMLDEVTPTTQEQPPSTQLDIGEV